MSYEVAIKRTIFTNVHDGSKTHGFRIYDCNGEQAYVNTMTEKDLLEKKGLDLLEHIVKDCHDVIKPFIGAIESGISIDDEEFTYEEIKGILRKS